jgi:hypothetical protein
MPERTTNLGTAAVPVWNVETLRAHMTALLDAFDVRMTERHTAADKAIKTAFEAQTTAMQAAFTAQREAVTTAFLSQKEAVNAALAAADRAVLKAELASEKRFESVNEFRGTLADQQRTLMPRAEAEAILRSLEVKLDSAVGTLTEKIETISKAQLATVSLGSGVQFGWQYSVAIIGFILAVLGIVGWFLGKSAVR